jgi:phosphoheptose isomerase
MKIQTEFLRVGEATTYFEQYFETQTLTKISSTNWRLIQDVVDDLAQILSEGNKVIVDIKILER